MSKYSLWLEPDGNIAYRLQERIQNLSKKYNTPMFEPHVTLLGNLRYGETELIQLTDTLATSLQPLELLLTRADSGDSFYQSIFVRVEKSKELGSARRLACRLFNMDESEVYMPHLSLMYGDMSRKDKERILNLMEREYQMRFTANFVRLVKTEGKPKDWKKIYSAVFK